MRLEDGKNKKVVQCMDWLPVPRLEQMRPNVGQKWSHPVTLRQHVGQPLISCQSVQLLVYSVEFK